MAPSSMDVALQTDTSGAARHGCGGSNARRHDGRGESAVGSASDSRRIGQAGHHGVGAHGVTSPSTTAAPLVTDVADLSDQSCHHTGVDGFLRRANSHGSSAVRVGPAFAPASANHPRQHYGTSHGGVDGATNS